MKTKTIRISILAIFALLLIFSGYLLARTKTSGGDSLLMRLASVGSSLSNKLTFAGNSMEPDTLNHPIFYTILVMAIVSDQRKSNNL